MRGLAETQAAFRNAIARAASPALLRSIVCAGVAEERLGIYRRHHRESFRRHLRGRYPTLEWLIGTDAIVALADRTILLKPPRAPSLAEYGEELVATVADNGDLPPYAADVARLDWRLGVLTVAIDVPSIAISALAVIDPGRIAGVTLRLQAGLAYLDAGWPVDELLHIRQGGEPPEQLVFTPRRTLLELRGARGRFSVRPLEAGRFAFRASLASGATLVVATDTATSAEPAFGLATELAALFAEGLVISHSGDNDNA